ncbi:SDR family NAD(P)-dependent oxidoreductase [Paenibacillus antibioticophila]|nr:SDR family oxidoreductase [Paenibacillus antibioticophila]
MPLFLYSTIHPFIRSESMRKVCVITGGGSGIGLATAKILGEKNDVIIVGRTAKKLESALDQLRTLGISAEALECDISDRSAVDHLAAIARSRGTITAVVHAAGMSPHMGDGETIMKVNALGTINVNESFYEVMEEGSCIVDISSMSAYLTPGFILPKRKYKYSRINIEVFMKKMMSRVNLFPQSLRSSVAYGISKHFVIWYAKMDAAKFGQKGIRVISISPGSFETPMGELEKDEVNECLKHSAIKRLGRAEEIADLIAYCTSDKASYLTGTDILCDGGCVASGYNPLKR